jgi:hypothetical protein
MPSVKPTLKARDRYLVARLDLFACRKNRTPVAFIIELSSDLIVISPSPLPQFAAQEATEDN